MQSHRDRRDDAIVLLATERKREEGILPLVNACSCYIESRHLDLLIAVLTLFIDIGPCLVLAHVYTDQRRIVDCKQ